MSRCELSGKGPVVENLVSHSNIKTKSKAYPNVNYKKVFCKALNQQITFKIAAKTIKDMEHMGGFDTYILNQCNTKLSVKAKSVKTRILRKLRTKKA